MFTSSYLLSSGGNDSSGYYSGGSSILMIALLLVIIDIVIFIYSMYCLFDCVEKKNIEVSTAVVIAVLHLVPGLGGFLSIGVIIYHVMYCGKAIGGQKLQKPPAFKFY